MKGHQIIQTSCKRGIVGAGTGFQVWSCDEELLSSGLVRTPEYRNLFVFDTPSKAGISSFGYAQLNDYGPVFNYNTRLAHDYAGEGTRSGNLLNHAVRLEGYAPDFYPVEAYGAGFWRTEMLESEVNSDETPPLLSTLDVKPADVITLQNVSEWIESDDRLELLESLISALFKAMADNRILVIIDTPENVIRWIAAIEYCLPLKLAGTIAFQNFAENAAAGKARIVGTSRESYEKLPQYSKASCVVFDENAGQVPDCELSGKYYDLVDLSFDLNPAAVADFVSFVDEYVDIDFNESSLSDACALHELWGDSVADWDQEAVGPGLRCAVNRGNNVLLQNLASKLLNQYESIDDLSEDPKFHILEFLIKRWSDLDEKDRGFVEGVAVSNLIGIMSNHSISGEEFFRRFGMIADACECVGLNIFEMLMEGNHQEQLVVASQSMQADKLGALCSALTDYVISKNVPGVDLNGKAPLGSLYAIIAAAATAQDYEQALEIMKRTLGRFSGELSRLGNLVLTFEFGIKKAYSQAGASIPLAQDVVIDEVWRRFIDELAVGGTVDAGKALRLLLWAEQRDEAMEVYIRLYFENLLGSCEKIADASSLYGVFAEKIQEADDAACDKCFVDVTATYFTYLTECMPEEVDRALGELLDRVLRSSVACDFAPELVSAATAGVSVCRPKREDILLVRRIRDYEVVTGVAALAGKPALLDVALAFDRAAKNNDFASAAARLEDLQGALDFEKLSRREQRDYLSWVSSSAVACIDDPYGFEVMLRAFCGQDNGSRCKLLESLFDAGIADFEKGEDERGLVLVGMYVVFHGDSFEEDVAVRFLGKLKKGYLEEEVASAGDRWILSEHRGDTASRRKWARLVRNASEKKGGLFSRFKR